MVGSPVIASLIAHASFWALILIGLSDLGWKCIAIFLALWIAGFAISPYVLGGFLFPSYVAVLDIALVFLIFRGDVRLS